MTKNIMRPGTLEDDTTEESFIPSVGKTKPKTPLIEEVPAIETSSEKPKVEVDIDPTDKQNPIERWQKGLATLGVSEKEAHNVIKLILKQGYWEKEYELWGGLLKITLRTRDAQHLLRVKNALDMLAERTQFAVGEVVRRCNLSGSLAKYQTTHLDHPTNKSTLEEVEECYQSRYDFVGRLPHPVVEQMVQALIHFEGIVAAITSEGAAQGF